MTDNEIIKAFKRCSNDSCTGCPYFYVPQEDNKTCSEMLTDDALDLINRQKAEIEKLKAENEVMKTNCNSMYVSMPNMAKAERTVAINEFAEKLKKRFYLSAGRCVVDVYHIDNLVKEMTEVSE